MRGFFVIEDEKYPMYVEGEWLRSKSIQLIQRRTIYV